MPKDDIDFDRLARVIPHARRALEPFRRSFHDSVKLAAGPHWGDVTNKTQPVNLIGMYLRTMARNLIAKNPRVKMSTYNQQAKPYVATMEIWANREIERVQLDRTLRRIVRDAMHTVGIAKVAIATPSDAAAVSWGLKAGQPCVWRISLDDFVFDHHAMDFNEATYIGHRYRVPIDTILSDSRNYGKNRKDLTPSVDRRYNEQGDEKVKTLGRGYTFDTEEFLDMVDLWEIWVPGWNQIVTFAADDAGHPWMPRGEPLRVQDWIGPYCGPYKFLCYEDVAGNAMPKGPVLDLIDLHEPANQALRKLIRQSQRMKKTLPTRNPEDFNRAKEADDGEGWRCEGDPPQELVTSAPDPQLFAFFMSIKDLFNYMSGNMESLAGLQPQAKTATQDKMLSASASAGVADMQETTVNWVAEIVDDLCWWWKYHPSKIMKAIKDIPQTNLSAAEQLTGQQRQQIDWDQIDIRTDPYSIRHKTPEERAAAMTQVMLQILTPLMPLLQQQQVGVDIQVFLRKLGEYMDMPDLPEILHMVQPPMTQDSGGGQPPAPTQPMKPAQTQRTYERVNRSEATQQGNQRMTLAMMMGKNPGGSQNGQAA